jgi:hypothetical protein
MHKIFDKKEKRVYGGGMSTAATAATVQSESALKLFYANTQKWLLNTWNELPSKIIAAPGQFTKHFYRPMGDWMGGVSSAASGLLGLSGPALVGFDSKKVSAGLGNLIKTTIGVLAGTTKTVFTSVIHAVSPETIKKATNTTAAAMQSSASGVWNAVKDAGTTTIGALQALLMSGQTDPRTA